VSALPTSAEELALNLADPMYRLSNLYYITVKSEGDEDGEGKRVLFQMNRHQRRFVERMWHRNIILKARQLGFTTLICILFLDHALFNKDQRCGIVAQDDGAAKAIFRDKVKYAYDNLPESLRRAMPLAKDAADELLFAHNNSSIRVATSMRSGTLDRLHVSEFGKICAKYPDKANEVITGSLPAAESGVVIIESTAEGQEGAFYDYTQLAQKKQQQRHKLTRKDFRLHFFPWWQADEYRMDPVGVHISDQDHDYFAKIERTEGCAIDAGQRAWYVATRDTDFVGREEKMWQEYPSTSDEAFQQSNDGAYYLKDMAKLRRRGGILDVPLLDVPVYTFWDIGNTDGCALWLMQRSRAGDRFVGYHEEHGEDLRHYARWLFDWAQDNELRFARHFLPHDAAHRKLSDYNKTTEEMLNELGVNNTVIVPPITDLQTGIQATRRALRDVVFDETRCKEGIARIDGYSRTWNKTLGKWIDSPNKTNGCSEGADALRQYAQAREAGLVPDAATYDPLPTRPDLDREERDDPPDWRL
jgi:hypothetical protein